MGLASYYGLYLLNICYCGVSLSNLLKICYLGLYLIKIDLLQSLGSFDPSLTNIGREDRGAVGVLLSPPRVPGKSSALARKSVFFYFVLQEGVLLPWQENVLFPTFSSLV